MYTRTGLLLVLLVLGAGCLAKGRPKATTSLTRQSDLQHRLSAIPERISEAQKALAAAQKQDNLELSICLKQKKPHCLNPGTFSDVQVAQMELRTAQRDQSELEEQSKSLQN